MNVASPRPKAPEVAPADFEESIPEDITVADPVLRDREAWHKARTLVMTKKTPSKERRASYTNAGGKPL